MTAATNIHDVLASIQTEAGTSLLTLTVASPVLLVFLRHFGCAFCRQAISDVAEARSELLARNVLPVFVHLGTPELASRYFEYYGLADVQRISDPAGAIYRDPAFALGRRHPALHLLDLRVWAGWLGGAAFRHGIGSLQDDAHQLPGLFLLQAGAIVRRYRYRSIADRPNYLRFVS